MPVIVDSDSARATALAHTAGNGSHVVSTVEQLEIWLERRPNEYAVVFGPEVDLTAAMGVADRLRLTRPGLSVILIRPEATTELMAQAMQSGIREVTGLAHTDSLRTSVWRSKEIYDAIHGPSSSDANSGKVITVFSPKGGVGKTTMSVNLALALSDNGSNRVCLVDLDLAFGDVAITLQLVPPHTIVEAAEVGDALDASMMANLLTRHDSGLQVLAAPTHPDAKDQIRTGIVRKVIQTLRGSFDYVVIDTSPGFDEQVLQAFDETDELLVVATLDVPAIKNVKMSLETLDVLSLALGHRWLVLNRADAEIGLTAEQVESILGMKLSAAFETSYEVANATNHGRPIVLSKPDHKMSRGLRQLAKDLSSPVERRPLEEAGAVVKRGLFGRKKAS